MLQPICAPDSCPPLDRSAGWPSTPLSACWGDDGEVRRVGALPDGGAAAAPALPTEYSPVAALRDWSPPTGSAVLVPLDGSWEAESAIPRAINYARTHAGGLLLVGVTGWPVANGAEPQLNRYLRAVAAPLLAGGLAVQTSVSVGMGAGAIVDAARLWGASIVVMAAHPFGDPEGDGNVFAARVLRRSAVPVVIVRLSQADGGRTDRLLDLRWGSASAGRRGLPARTMAGGREHDDRSAGGRGGCPARLGDAPGTRR